MSLLHLLKATSLVGETTTLDMSIFQVLLPSSRETLLHVPMYYKGRVTKPTTFHSSLPLKFPVSWFHSINTLAREVILSHMPLLHPPHTSTDVLSIFLVLVLFPPHLPPGGGPARLGVIEWVPLLVTKVWHPGQHDVHLGAVTARGNGSEGGRVTVARGAGEAGEVCRTGRSAGEVPH